MGVPPFCRKHPYKISLSNLRALPKHQFESEENGTSEQIRGTQQPVETAPKSCFSKGRVTFTAPSSGAEVRRKGIPPKYICLI